MYLSQAHEISFEIIVVGEGANVFNGFKKENLRYREEIDIISYTVKRSNYAISISKVANISTLFILVNQSKSLIQYFHSMHIFLFDQVNFIREFVFTALENSSNPFYDTIDCTALCVGKVITNRGIPAGNLPAMTRSCIE